MRPGFPAPPQTPQFAAAVLPVGAATIATGYCAVAPSLYSRQGDVPGTQGDHEMLKFLNGAA
jgi:hypothetical protein